MSHTDELLLTETFGPTVQGEGPSAGQVAVFVRLSRCNLHCPTCDEPHTWDTTRFDLHDHTRHLGVDAVLGWVLARSAPLVVLTGGEPLLQQRKLLPLVHGLVAAGRRVEVETNGTIAPALELVRAGVRFNVSPKLPGFAAVGDEPVVPGALEALAAADSICKFVIPTREPGRAWAAADEIAARYNFSQVWVMPEGTTSAEIASGLHALAEPALERGWCLSGRLHVQLWENACGR